MKTATEIMLHYYEERGNKLLAMLADGEDIIGEEITLEIRGREFGDPPLGTFTAKITKWNKPTPPKDR